MLFLEYFIWGAWYVTVGTWLGQGLHFTGEQIGLVAGTTAIGAIASPFFIGMIADRLFATQKVLAVLHGSGRGAALSRLFACGLWADLSACAALCDRLHADGFADQLAGLSADDAIPKMQFGPIRMLGTFGWIVAGLLIGSLKLEATAMPMRLAAAASLLHGDLLPYAAGYAAARRFEELRH